VAVQKVHEPSHYPTQQSVEAMQFVNAEFLPYCGGTSFVDPLMNGVTSPYVKALHHRLGLLNPALYTIAAQGHGGPHAPVRDITRGNNWYWQAAPGYDQTTGLGAPDVANLLEALRNLEP
jgi:kumamolisin